MYTYAIKRSIKAPACQSGKRPSAFHLRQYGLCLGHFRPSSTLQKEIYLGKLTQFITKLMAVKFVTHAHFIQLTN